MIQLKDLATEKVTVISGPYGAGKTNVAVNLAMDIAKSGQICRIADLDIVNPYFRSADNAKMLDAMGVQTMIPEFANTNVDIPSLPRFPVSPLGIGDDFDFSIIDVGGDDGAVALGMYNSTIKTLDYDLYYVVNVYRPLIADPKDALECMREIEFSSGLRCTKLVNNSSLGVETTADDIVESVEYAKECAALCGIPLVAHTYSPAYAPDTLWKFAAAGYSGEPLFALSDITKKLF